MDRIKLLEAIQARRRDETLTETVTYALDRLIEENFPGTVRDAVERTREQEREG